jgi:hypothetical protein
MHADGGSWMVHAGGALAAATLAFGLGGCATGGYGARLNDHVEVYAPFDNERDSGPGYLVGPPQQYLRDETSVADPSAPPLTSPP